jgi:hypothetical protein
MDRSKTKLDRAPAAARSWSLPAVCGLIEHVFRIFQQFTYHGVPKENLNLVTSPCVDRGPNMSSSISWGRAVFALCLAGGAEAFPVSHLALAIRAPDGRAARAPGASRAIARTSPSSFLLRAGQHRPGARHMALSDGAERSGRHRDQLLGPLLERDAR